MCFELSISRYVREVRLLNVNWTTMSIRFWRPWKFVDGLNTCHLAWKWCGFFWHCLRYVKLNSEIKIYFEKRAAIVYHRNPIKKCREEGKTRHETIMLNTRVVMHLWNYINAGDIIATLTRIRYANNSFDLENSTWKDKSNILKSPFN